MNTRKTVYEKLFSNQTTELAKHEVELAIADDLKKAYDEAIAGRKKSFDIMQKIKADTLAAVKQLNDVKKINENALPIFAKYETAVKELGLPLPAEIVNQKKNIQDGLKGTLTSYIKTLESIKFF